MSSIRIDNNRNYPKIADCHGMTWYDPLNARTVTWASWAVCGQVTVNCILNTGRPLINTANGSCMFGMLFKFVIIKLKNKGD